MCGSGWGPALVGSLYRDPKGLGLQAQGCEGISVDHEPELLPFSGCCGGDVLWQGMCWVKDPYDHEALNSLTSSHLPSKTLSLSSGSLVTSYKHPIVRKEPGGSK